MARPRTASLDEAEQRRLKLAAYRLGEEQPAAELDISSGTLARAVAGFGVARGTRMLIRVRLAELEGKLAA